MSDRQCVARVSAPLGWESYRRCRNDKAPGGDVCAEHEANGWVHHDPAVWLAMQAVPKVDHAAAAAQRDAERMAWRRLCKRCSMPTTPDRVFCSSECFRAHRDGAS